MQLYKVKLSETSDALETQRVDGYLGNNFGDGNIALYTRGEALKKARLFSGKIEPHGKNYVTTEETIITLIGKEVDTRIIRELNGRETFTTPDDDMGFRMYNSDIFNAILNEQMEIAEVLRFKDSILDELNVLDNLVQRYEYVII